MAALFIVDTHCDTLLVRADLPREKQAPCVTPEALRAGGVTLQVCALYAGSYGPNAKGWQNPEAIAAAELAALPQLTGRGVRKVDSPFEAKEGENCVMLSLEGAEVFGDSLEKLRAFREKGARLCALTWNYENLLAYPHCADGHRGLKPFGWDCVREMAKLGMAVDVSHLGEGGFWDLIFHAEKPPMASHSCCRKLCNSTRNLTDDQICALIERGGWIGVNFYTYFINGEPRCMLDDLCDHFVHIAELGGVKHMGFGSDFDGIESSPQGLESPADLPRLIDMLRLRGFNEEEIEGIAGKNFLDYFRRIDG